MARRKDQGTEKPSGKTGISGKKGASSFTRGHSASKGGVLVTTAKPDDLAKASQPTPGQPKGRRLKLSVLGISSELLDKSDPAYKSAIRTAASYRKYRAKELFNFHGHVSAGVSALLATASLALAASRFLYGKIAVTGDISYLGQASKLADSARQNELAAWELCAREGVAVKKLKAMEQSVPWLAQQDGGEAKRGRKRAADKAKEEAVIDVPALPPVGGDLLGWVAACATTPTTKSEGVAATTKQETKNGLESNRRSTVPVVPGVPGDGTEPNGRPEKMYRAASGDEGPQTAAACERNADSEAPGHAEHHWDASTADD